MAPASRASGESLRVRPSSSTRMGRYSYLEELYCRGANAHTTLGFHRTCASAAPPARALRPRRGGGAALAVGICAAANRPAPVSRASADRSSARHRVAGRADDAAAAASTCGKALGVPGLLMKDEGSLPTGTFKARGAAVGGLAGSRARHRGHRHADERQRRRGVGGVLGASRDAERWCSMPIAAPQVTKDECATMGASLLLVDGLIDDAGAIVGRLRAAVGVVRRLHAQGALPDRGQKDDRARTGGAARLGGARRPRLSGRRWSGADRHPQSAASSCSSSG